MKARQGGLSVEEAQQRFAEATSPEEQRNVIGAMQPKAKGRATWSLKVG
ncbi:hypothetical protein [Streptomyces spectabilis]|uniref:Uncharacterized protein n=1 Tax=Streptomyces spectabilis TaxID=68270 RepID=A0A7W8AN09_STRST|nr:hypothetical protein [Streptomyces spectabilis]MBB5101416.1 hypothetical protein [Streptomyces spectabilis]MCI3900610.1 hypothetical protein [Streptomyces spectabilis]GGV11282.1 hypothetical protein GCM10010245_21000 [Streptomyces spectabilis]